MVDQAWIKDLLIFLATAGFIVPIFRRFKVGTVPGFLIAGIVLGPHGIGRFATELPFLNSITLTTAERVAPFAELGILFLLFVIGLEVSPERLRAMRRLVAGLGGSQVMLTAALIGLATAMAGMPSAAAVVLGLALSFASTAVVVPVLIEGGRWTTPVGRTSFAVLLAQDMAVVPIVMLVQILAGNSGGEAAFLSVLRDLATALLAVGTIVLIGRFGLRPLLRSAAATGSRELVLAIALFLAISAGLITAAAGMSPALGAFLAGLLLSGSEFRHQLEIDIDPFKGLLLGLFFMTVGMGLDLVLFGDIGGWIVVSVLGLVAIKAIILFCLSLGFGLGPAVAIEAGLTLAGCGEFAFVVLTLAGGEGMIDPQGLAFINAIVVLTMLATPFLALLGRKLGACLEHQRDSRDSGPDGGAERLSDHVVIGGYGRVGQLIARLLEENGVPYVAVDLNVARVEEGRRRGKPIHFGDISRGEMLALIGAKSANSFVITTDEPSKVELTVRAIRDGWPDALIYARARDEAHAGRLLMLGASAVVPEAVEGSLQLAGMVLEGIGLPGETVEACLGRARAKAQAAGRIGVEG